MFKLKYLCWFICCTNICLVSAARTSVAGNPYFGIQVVDEQTGRGVPLVELTTTNPIRWVTDSNGWVAIDDPDLIGRNVYFAVRSHGYEYPKDGFGFSGQTLFVSAGATAKLNVKRNNLAERLYRVTGSGIYKDSILLNQPVPVTKPLLNGDVFGCDSVMSVLHDGKIYWFWGDTTRPRYPIGGNFHVSGATSALPANGGLDPNVGVHFDYFVGTENAVRPLAPMPGAGPTWISAVNVLNATDEQPRIYANYVKIRNGLEAYQ